jgi:sulfur carrier protein
MTARIAVTVNGERLSVPADASLGGLVDDAAGRRAGVAAALNETVVPRTAWDETQVREGDRIEVVSAVQGG